VVVLRQFNRLWFSVSQTIYLFSICYGYDSGHVRGLPPASHDWWLDRESQQYLANSASTPTTEKVLQTPASGRLEHFFGCWSWCAVGIIGVVFWFL